MDLAIGDILCVKLTGELVTVMKLLSETNKEVMVRRPVVSHETGIKHELCYFFPFELESEEAHLQRDAQAMVLKYKVQRQLQKEMDKLEEEEREANKPAGVNPGLLVN